MRKKMIALTLLCCFLLTACGGTTAAVQENIWDNAVYTDETYDVIVVGTEPEGIAAAVSAAAMV